MDDTWVKIQFQENEAFTNHINSVDRNIEFTGEDANTNMLPLLNCAMHTEGDEILNN